MSQLQTSDVMVRGYVAALLLDMWWFLGNNSLTITDFIDGNKIKKVFFVVMLQNYLKNKSSGSRFAFQNCQSYM